MPHETGRLNQPVLHAALKDVAILREDSAVRQGLEAIRQRGLGEKIGYFCIVERDDRQVGIRPTLRLLSAGLVHRHSDVMIQRVVAVPANAAVTEACEAFILTLVLGLAERVRIQSMTVTIQALRVMLPTLRRYATALGREAETAVMLGAACGVVVGLIAWLRRSSGLAAVAIGGNISLALCTACLFGLKVCSKLCAPS